MNERVIRCAKALATTLERLLAFGILLGVVVFAFQSTFAVTGMDWRSTEAFYELMDRVLLLVIGVELIRPLVTHDLWLSWSFSPSLPRKMLKPELPTVDILLGVVAFVGLLAARRFLLPSLAGEPKQEGGAKSE